MNRSERSTARFDSRLLLETSRLLMESNEPGAIARNLGLVLMGKLLVSQAAVLLPAGKGEGLELAFLRGRSPWKEGSRIPNGDEIDLAAELFPSAASCWTRPVGTSRAPRGMLVFGMRKAQDPFGEDQLDLIENTCNLAAIALDHAAAIRNLRETNRVLDRRVHELNTLFELSKEFGALLDRRSIADVLKFTLMGHFAVRQTMIAIRSDTAAGGGSMGRDGAGGGTAVEHNGIELLAAGGLKRTPAPGELSTCFEEVRLAPADVCLDASNPFMLEHGLAALIGLPGVSAANGTGSLKAVIGLGRKPGGSSFSDDDIQFVRSVCHLALMSIENARMVAQMIEKRRMEEELSIARKIQTQLIPDPIPQIPGLEAAAVNIPSKEVGGDYVDVAQTPDGNMIYAIADVSGKGVPASLLMANLQAMIQVLLPIDISLSDAVGRINDLLHEHTPSDRFITFFLAKYHRGTGRLDYVNAGHNPPMLFRNGSAGIPERLEEGGMLLGAMPTFQAYGMGSVTMRKGDLMVLFTDGVTETMDREENEEYGEDRLVAAVSRLLDGGAQAGAVLDGILDDVRLFGPGVFSDDLTVLVLRKTD